MSHDSLRSDDTPNDSNYHNVFLSFAFTLSPPLAPHATRPVRLDEAVHRIQKTHPRDPHPTPDYGDVGYCVDRDLNYGEARLRTVEGSKLWDIIGSGPVRIDEAVHRIRKKSDFMNNPVTKKIYVNLKRDLQQEYHTVWHQNLYSLTSFTNDVEKWTFKRTAFWRRRDYLILSSKIYSNYICIFRGGINDR